MRSISTRKIYRYEHVTSTTNHWCQYICDHVHGGNNFALSIDGCQDFVIAVLMPTKRSNQRHRYNYTNLTVTVSHMVTLSITFCNGQFFCCNNENKSKFKNISRSYAPAGLHEKMFEREIQTIKGRQVAL